MQQFVSIPGKSAITSDRSPVKWSNQILQGQRYALPGVVPNCEDHLRIEFCKQSQDV
jgi:hypothetical protein